MATVLKLYELSDALADLYDRLSEAEGELTPELEAELDALTGSWTDKVDGICGLRQQMLRDAQAAEAEAERLRDLAKARANAAKSLEGYLLREHRKLGREKTDTPRFRVSVSQNGGLAPLRLLMDAERLPKKYQRVKVEANTQAIREALAAGSKLKFAVLEPRGVHLRIK